MSQVNIEKSALDPREVRYLTLENGLRAFLVSDPTTDKAAASMNVRVGQLSDPVELPGLAHFLEHMLFLGTEKYPDEQAYSKLLNAHGGRSNAYTALEDTNYYFDITHPHLYDALDIFAEFFISPLFTESATERECNAVDSENEKNLQNDFWRQYQLLKTAASPAHPFSHYGNGNIRTLSTIPKEKGIDVRKALLDFHATYYSASVMCLCVIGSGPIDELEREVVRRFSLVPTSGRKAPTFLPADVPRPPHLPLNFATAQVFKIVPVKDVKKLVLQFPVRSILPHYRVDPCGYLAHLVGHEGPGSILSLLKRRGWATGLSAYPAASTSDFALFTVSVELSDAGLSNAEEISVIIFQYINMLREEGVQEWIFKEIKAISELTFRFLEKREPIHEVVDFAESMQLFAPEHVMSGRYVYGDFDADVISAVLSELTPDSVRMSIIAKAMESQTNAAERWYGTKYSQADVDPALIERWTCSPRHADLALPAPNEFIPTSLEQKAPEDANQGYAPALIVDTKALRLWHKQDVTFNRPRAVATFFFATPVVNSTPRSALVAQLYVDLVMEALNEFLYPARLAGMRCQIYVRNDGIKLHATGYDSKLGVLLRRVSQILVELVPRPLEFDMLYEKLRLRLDNKRKAQPYAVAKDWLLEATLGEWTWEDKLDAINGITQEEVFAFGRQLFESAAVEALVIGNVHKDDALKLAAEVQEAIAYRPLPKSARPIQRETVVGDGETYVFQHTTRNPEDSNACLYTFLELGSYGDMQAAAQSALIGQLIKEEAFDSLRTKEQLGYIVWAGPMRIRRRVGVRFTVQSPTKDPVYIEQRVEAFVAMFEGILAKMSAEEFQKYVDAVVADIEEKDKKLSQEASRHWEEIYYEAYMFDRVGAKVEAVKALTLDMVRNVWKDAISRGAPKRRVFSVQLFNSTVQPPEVFEQDGERIASTVAFRNSHALHPGRL